MSEKYMVLVPPCMLAPGLQAVRNTSCEQWRMQCLQLVVEYGVDIIPFPCVETEFGGCQKGLHREKHGLDYYSAQKGYEDYCEVCAEKLAELVSEMMKKGYQMVAIMGIEHSPSCAVNYLYTHTGTQKRSGIFMTAVKEKLKNLVSEDVYIGINRKYPRKAIKLLQERLQIVTEM